jgi:hypothetical protein
LLLLLFVFERLPSEAATLFVAELVDVLLDVVPPALAVLLVELAVSTQESHSTDLELRIIPRLGHIPLTQLRPSVVERFAADLERDGIGRATIVSTLAVLQGVMKRPSATTTCRATPSSRSTSPPSAATASRSSSTSSRSSGCECGVLVVRTSARRRC